MHMCLKFKKIMCFNIYPGHVKIVSTTGHPKKNMFQKTVFP